MITFGVRKTTAVLRFYLTASEVCDSVCSEENHGSNKVQPEVTLAASDVAAEVCDSRGGGSATATMVMAIPIVKQNVGVVNVEALKRAWHSIS